MQAGTAGGIREAANDAEFGLLLEQASILVVDDEPGMRNFLMRTLGPRCKHLEVAADAGEAARKLDAQHFDVVIVEEAKTEFDLLDQQIYRISQLVTKLLQFARPEEYAGFVERHAPGDVIADCLPLVRHVLNKAEIEIVREDAATRLVLMNRTELQQVLVNLIVNAVYAMPDGGRLSLRTRDADFDDQQGVVIEVADTGVGMSKDVVDKVLIYAMSPTGSPHGTVLNRRVHATGQPANANGGAVGPARSTVPRSRTTICWHAWTWAMLLGAQITVVVPRIESR